MLCAFCLSQWRLDTYANSVPSTSSGGMSDEEEWVGFGAITLVMSYGIGKQGVARVILEVTCIR